MSSIVTQSLPLPLVKRSRGGEHRCIVPGALGGAREVGKARLAAEIVEIGVDRRALEPGREPEPAHTFLTDHRGNATPQPPRAHVGKASGRDRGGPSGEKSAGADPNKKKTTKQ